MILEIENVSKSYGSVKALDDISLSIADPTILAILGRNGAGKTTLISLVATLLTPDVGRLNILGRDILKDPAFARSAISLCAQSSTLEPALSVRANLNLILRLSGLDAAAAKNRVDELLAGDLLSDIADKKVWILSGGNRRRVDILASLASEPSILLLDEPTTGLDPESRSAIWTMITSARARRTTVLFSTQYLEEAEAYAERIVFIGNGRIVADDPPAQLKARHGARVLEVLLSDPSQADRASMILNCAVKTAASRLLLAAPEGMSSLERHVAELKAHEIGIEEIVLRHPSLDEVFRSIAGSDGRNISQ